jgi:predicted Rossmann-fold nucleotide-binding protein
MGAIANAVYSNNGNVFGIIPRALMDYERKPNEVSAISVNGIDQAIKKPDLLSEASDKSRSVFWPVKTMHQRKQ